MGYTLGVYNARDATGWTTFTNPSAATPVYYVSDSQGHDNNTGTSTTTNTSGAGGPGPFKTLGKLFTTASAAGLGVGRWLLLRRGDTFDGQCLGQDQGTGDLENYGATNDPLVISSYDEAIAVNTSTGAGVDPAGSSRARPIVIPPDNTAIISCTGGLATSGGNWTAVVGIKIYNKWGDPGNGSYNGHTNTTAISITLNPITWTLIEDCEISFFGIAINGPWLIHRRNSVHDCAVVTVGHAAGVHGGDANWVLDESVVVRSGEGDAVFDHNLYIDGVIRKGDARTRFGNMKQRGNLLFRGGRTNQFRSGYLIENNCNLNQNGGQNIGCPFIGVDNFITNNVWTELDNTPLPSPPNVSAPTFLTTTLEVGKYDGSDATNQGNLLVDGNICSNAVATSGIGGMTGDPGADHVTYSNNIFYKWGTADTQPNNTIKHYSGSIRKDGLTITNAGSGYTAKSTNVSAVAVEAATNYTLPGGDLVLTVGSIADFNSNDGGGSGATSVYLSGFTGGSGGFDAALNGHIFKCAVLDAANKKIVLFSSNTVPGSYGSGGTVYTPYRHYALNGGSGNSATVDIIVGPSGIVGFDYAGSEGPLSGTGQDGGGNLPNNAGVLYAVNDLLTCSALNTAAGGTNFQCRVDALATITISGASLSVNGSTGLITPTGGSNIFDPAGSNPGAFSAPTRTSATYASYLGVGSTRDSFIAAAVANNKAGWNSLYTAASLNDYIRQGFSKTMIGSGYADGVAPVTPPVLMPQICM